MVFLLLDLPKSLRVTTHLVVEISALDTKLIMPTALISFMKELDFTAISISNINRFVKGQKVLINKAKF